MPDRRLETMDGQQRRIEVARPHDEELGPLQKLPGRWVGEGTGWNMIALPFAQDGPLDYRLLLNQYDEDDVPSFESLASDHFARIAALKPELVIFGSGARLRFPAPALLRPLIDAGIGVETMDTAAACRTYNVLLAEGRSVVAGLLFSRDASAVR